MNNQDAPIKFCYRIGQINPANGQRNFAIIWQERDLPFQLDWDHIFLFGRDTLVQITIMFMDHFIHREDACIEFVY